MGLENKVEELPQIIRKRFEINRKVYDLIERINDPKNKKRSEIKMWTVGDIGRDLVVLTELPDRVNVATYVEDYEADESYGEKRRYITQGHCPRGLYVWLWRFSEHCKVWELTDAESYIVLDACSFLINLSRGDKTHEFSVYGPHWDKKLSTYAKIVSRIHWLSYFAFSRVENVQSQLDEISRGEGE